MQNKQVKKQNSLRKEVSMKIFKIQLLCIILSLAVNCLYAQSGTKTELESYAESHKKEFSHALKMTRDFAPRFKEAGFANERFALAIVFPELMRYSEFQDSIEANTTELMYSLGTKSLICSIGCFQMKPTFASHMEMLIAKDEGMRKKYAKINFYGKDDTKDSRYERIKRLRNVDYQILYLEAFIESCEKKFNLEGKPVDYKIKIISTAYNTGFSNTIEMLEERAKKCTYPEGKNNPKSKWHYWNISIDAYKIISPTTGLPFRQRAE